MQCIFIFGLVWFYDTSTIEGYLMPNLFYTYTLNIWFGLVEFYGLSTIVCYLMPNLFYTYTLNIWFGLVAFYGLSSIVGYLMPNLLYTYILNIWFGWVLWLINHSRLFNAKFVLYIYIKCIWFKMVELKFRIKSFQVLLCMSFVYTQLNNQIVLFQAIQFSISHLFTRSLNTKKLYLTRR